jgi:gliding motility-associated-like protein
MRKYLLLLISLGFLFTASFAQNKSNKGKEFWVGYGHNQLFGGNGETFVLYLSAEQAALVNVTIPSLGWSKTYSIAANTAITTDVIPTSARILAEGINNNGIHIESDVPIVAYAHQYGGSSSGATMLMPVETYGYTYYSLNYTQVTNSTPAYSWFFVVASEDNTKLEITPSVLTQGGRPANQTYTITLNKGQIYNVFGQSSGTTGQDLTGSKIVSVADNLNGVCHPIAVFSGASRMTICNTSSGEFMQQQIFPSSAWGTRYLTYPTVSTNGVAIKNINFFRIAVRDPSTIVKKNGVVMTSLINNFYYDYSSNNGDYIEADKPILVEQLTPSTSVNCTGYSGLGDPEMFYLSPIEQSIKKAVFFNTSNAGISSNFICAIVPTAGIPTLKVDGSTSFNLIAPHPQNSNYSVAIKTLAANQQHIIECDSSFTAITYGFGNVESYGYNAGTLINNLNNIGGLQNSFGTGVSSSTCTKTPFRFSVKAAYKPTQMVWQLSQIPILQPVNADTTVNNPTPIDSSFINGRKYYTYMLPREYYLNTPGTYTLPIVVTAPEIDNCSNTETITTQITVVPGPVPDFTWTYSGCVSDTAYLNGINPTVGGFTISKYRWFYDDNTQDSLKNVKKKFNSQGNHPTTFRVITNTGCIGDTTKTLVTAASPLATFGMNPPQACGSATVAFTDTSSFPNGAPLTNWYWDFGNGTVINAPTNAPQTQTYTTSGTYFIKHVAGVAGGCGSDTARRTLYIYANPVVDFTYNLGCLQDSTLQLTNATTISDGQALTWSWNFGEPSSGVNNTSTLLNPTHKYGSYNTFPITLVATTANGCTGTKTKNYTVTGFSSAINYTIANENNLCSNKQVAITSGVNIAQDSVYKIEIYWDYVGQPTVFTTYNNPVQNAVYTNLYPAFTTPATKTYTVRWVVYSKGGCVSEKIKTITVNAKPALQFNTLQGKCVNAGIVSIANGNITNGLVGTGTYSGIGTDASGNFDPAVAGVGVFPIKYLFVSDVGCKDSITQNIRVFPKPNAKFGYLRDVCLGDSTRFKDSSTISSGNITTWNWNFGDNNGATKNNANAFFYTYAAANTYTVKLVAISDSACVSDTFSLPVLVRDRPVSTFTMSQRLCKDTSVTFTPSSSFGTGTIQNWYWSFGNGQTVNNTNSNPVTTTYTNYGSFTVKHAVNAGQGCVSDTATQTFTIYDNPVAGFTMSSGCLPDSTATFTDATTVNDGQTFTWSWLFNDPNATVANPNTSIAQSPTHRFTQYGTYPIKLSVVTPNGCSSTKTQNFRVRGFLPTIVFNVANENTLCSNKPVRLTNQTPVTIDSIYRIDIYWDFANQPTVFQTDLAPALGKTYSYTYPTFTTPAIKTYTIKWVVYSKGICNTEITKTITLNAMPTLTFGTLQGKCVNSVPVSIANANVTNALAGTGVYVGNGTDAAGLFTPANAGVGQYNIKYIYTTTGGCIDSISSSIRVFPKPVAGFDFVQNICFKDSVLLKDTSKISSGTLQSRNWDFGDNITQVKTNASPFYHPYANYGPYTIKLYVVSDSSCVSDTAKQDINVYPLPQVAFTIPTGVCLPVGKASFTNQTTLVNGTPSQLTYIWDFGDGTPTVQGFEPTHNYAAAGSYPVFLTAVSPVGCIDTLTKVLDKFYQDPVADFTIVADTLCPKYTIKFIDNSTAPNSTIATWKWAFGNGDSAFVQSPLYPYPLSGDYFVNLTVTNPDGCTSITKTKPITIYKQPVIDAGPNFLVPAFTPVKLQTVINDSAAFHYLWTPSTYLDDDTLLRPISTAAFNVTYKVMAYGGGGNCVAYDTVKVTALQQLVIANAFSPNGDGVNDVWEIPYLNDYPEAKVEIFNRAGQVVFTSVAYTKTWDGKMNGKPLPAGTYYYIIEPKNNGYSKLSGYVTILR